MTKAELAHANEINEQIEVLERFLDSTERNWRKLSFFRKSEPQNTQVTLQTAYGYCQDAIEASPRLSEGITEAIRNELKLLQDELDSIGKCPSDEVETNRGGVIPDGR